MYKTRLSSSSGSRCRVPIKISKTGLIILRIPIRQSNFSCCSLFINHCFELLHITKSTVSIAVVVGINNLWLKVSYRRGRLLNAHGVGQVHANKCDIDIFQLSHFADVFRIA